MGTPKKYPKGTWTICSLSFSLWKHTWNILKWRISYHNIFKHIPGPLQKMGAKWMKVEHFQCNNFQGPFLAQIDTPANGWMSRWLNLWRLLCPTYLSDYIHLGSPKMWLGRWSCCFFFWGFQKGWSWGWVDTQKTTKHFWGRFFWLFFVVLYKLNTFCHMLYVQYGSSKWRTVTEWCN